MNLIECVVTDILSKPYDAHGLWFVRVSFTSYGHNGDSTLMFKSKEEAEAIEKGYKFLA